MILLSRNDFRESCLERDKNACVVCGEKDQLAVHHIIERRLWDDGGYYMNNGATLCDPCHIKAESTEFSCEFIREQTGITKIVLPDGWYHDVEYTKWGDVILPNKLRMRGPLFDDDSVQKVLKIGPYYTFYTDYVKYPRSYHLPWSEGKTNDDKVHPDCSIFEQNDVVVTEKLDGENTTIYRDYVHARSIDGRNHWSRSWVKNLQAQIGYEIPEGWRICCENLYAKHSIKYTNLDSYVYVFSIWNEKNVCLSWDETVAYCDILGLPTVPVLYRGLWDEKAVRALYSDAKRATSEGYVARNSREFKYLDFKKNLGKFVRKEHIATSHHWFFDCSEKNELKQQ